MKFLKLDLTILTMILLFAATSVFAQQEGAKKEKKVVIITKTIDEDGNEVTKEIIKKGEDANIFIIEHEGEEGVHELHKNVQVDVDNENGEKRVKIRIVKGEGDDDVEVIEWSGEEGMPADMLKELQEKGIHIEMGTDNDFYFNSNDAPNSACLGVMIGTKKTVENINGEETIVTEGESDQGVSILEILEGSGAADAGLAKDDIITEINGTEISSIEDVLNVLSPFEAGTTVSVNYLRGKQAQQVTATLKACGNNNKEVEEELEWIDEDGNNINLNGNNWIFIDDEGNESNGQNRKIIIKKSKDGEEVIIEKIELDGDEVNEFTPEGQRTLDIQTIDIFPNPTDGKLTLEFTAPIAPTTVKVIDTSGREVYSEELNDFDGKFNKVIDLSKGAVGTMVLSIQQGDKVFSEKIILQK
jgi:murein DD-endopeptidase MepM/ murein hydrolase activator NlpD